MKTPHHRRRLRLLAAGATLATTALVIFPAGSATAANAGDQPFSGWVRNYSGFVGAELLNGAINARANIGEAIAVADSTGLNKPGYVGTSTGDLAVPGQLATDPTSRSYARTAPVGAGLIGLNLQPMKTESTSTTVVDGGLETLSTPLSFLDLSPIGKISLLAGLTDSNWNAGVLANGGRLAYADSSVGTLELLNSGIPGLNIPIPIPGLSNLFPMAQVELGQNTSEVKLVGDTTACPTGLAVQSRASWDLADLHLLSGFIDVSVAGNAGGGTPDSAVMTAKASGLPAGAKVTVPELGDLTVNVGTMNLTLKPGMSLEIGKILKDAGGLGTTLSALIDGEISFEGVTDVHEAADGTWAHGAINGATVNLSLLPVPIIAPNGLGAAEVGVMRGEVDAVAPAGGLNCSTTTGTTTTGTTTTGTTTTGTPVTGTTTTGTTTTGTTTTGTTTTGTPATGTTTTSTDVAGTTITGTTSVGVTTTGTPATGVTTTGTPTSGTPATGTPATGTTTTSTDVAGTTITGTTSVGVTTTGTPTTGTPATGTPATGTPATGTPATGTPATGTPATGTPATGTPATGTPATGTPATGTPATGTPATGTPATGTPATGATVVSPPSGTPASGAATTGATTNGGVLPNTGGVPVQLVALGAGLLLLGGGLIGATRHRMRSAR